jgi:hypothetical protein
MSFTRFNCFEGAASIAASGYGNNAAGGTNGTAVTTGNSGGSSGTAFNGVGGGVTFDSTQSFGASPLSYKFTAVASTALVEWSTTVLGSATIQYASAMVNLGLLPTSATAAYLIEAATPAYYLKFDGTHWSARAGSGTIATSVSTPAANTWYQITLAICPNGTSGYCIARIYDSSGNLIEALIATGGTTATNSIIYFGNASGNITGIFWMTNLAISTSPVPPDTDGPVIAVANSGLRSGYCVDLANTQGNPLYSTMVSHSGAYSMACNPNAATIAQFPQIAWNVPYNVSLFTRTWVYVTAMGTQLYLTRYHDASVGIVSVLLGTNSKISITLTGATTANGSYALSANTWYRVEMTYTPGAGTASAGVRLYDNSGNLLDSATIATGGTLSTAAGGFVSFGNQGGQTTVKYYFDDVAVSDQGWIGAAMPGTWPLVFAKQNNAEGGTNATAATAGNSGGASGDPFDIPLGSANFTFSNTEAMDGSLSYKCSATSTSGVYGNWFFGNVNATFDVYVRFGFYFPSLPVTSNTLLVDCIDETGNSQNYILIGTSGVVLIQMASKAAHTVFTCQAATWYRVDAHFHVDPVSGYAEMNIYNGLTGAFIESVQTATVASASFQYVDIGLQQPYNGLVVYVDSMLCSDVSLPMSGADAGSCADAWSLHAAVPDADASAPAADAWSLHAAVPDADASAPAADAWSLLAEVSSADDSSPTADSWALHASLGSADAGLGADAAWLGLADADLGSGADSGILGILSTDFVTGADAAFLAVSEHDSDTGSFADSATLAAVLGDSDQGAIADAAGLTAEIADADSGSAADAEALGVGDHDEGTIEEIGRFYRKYPDAQGHVATAPSSTYTAEE